MKYYMEPDDNDEIVHDKSYFMDRAYDLQHPIIVEGMRVGRLRAYGNAIVAPQAIEFVKAGMGYLRCS